MGGGTVLPLGHPPTSGGLSPRGRGNHLLQPAPDLGGGSIPAWAGEPVVILNPNVQPGVYPRVGGGTMARSKARSRMIGLSPRGRGNQGVQRSTRRRIRSIPAWAGEPAEGVYIYSQFTVYPRVGGGTLPAPFPLPPCPGLSPRGRGNPPHVELPHPETGSIPAWAGEPSARRTSSSRNGVYPSVGGGTPRRS